MVDEPWYKDGLKFKCTGCGKCCTGGPGYVWIDEHEVAEMAAFLKMTPKDFEKMFTRHAYGRLALVENKISFDCVFLRDKKCLVYGARPKQCRKFPFWHENVKTPQRWDATAQLCEGINHPDAPLISFEKIEEERNS